MTDTPTAATTLSLPADAVLLDLDVVDAPSAIRALGARLVAVGAITPSYVEAVVAREKTYPTGLPTSPEPIALPHADPDGVLVPTVALGRCRSPVEFIEMATTDRRLSVRLIVLLALQSKDQATVLSRLVRAFGEPELMAFVLSSDRPAEIAARLTGRIAGDADA